jgi:trans-L-3-hydroxyproline dehydratase
MAILFARQEIGLNQHVVIESIIGTTFTGCVADTTTFGPHRAIIPEVTGSAYITGVNELCLDPDDPLREGFILR